MANNGSQCFNPRHSDPRLTLRTYAKVQIHDLGAILENMPGPASDSPQAQQARATGTYGRAQPGPARRAAEITPPPSHAESVPLRVGAHGRNRNIDGNQCPHPGPQSADDSVRVGAAWCEAESDTGTDHERRNPLRLAGLCGSVRSDSIGCESAEGRTRTADLDVMNVPL